ncbi:hypothetical protein NIES73_33910 [Sphaerospermopsis kisseleviana NIES-73]|nr:hypothetical protein NIES73_33910 [Sphaerospermopsis kisseleviana NIES-73]
MIFQSIEPQRDTERREKKVGVIHESPLRNHRKVLI